MRCCSMAVPCCAVLLFVAVLWLCHAPVALRRVPSCVCVCVQALASKARIILKAKHLYAADGKAVKELLKVARTLYKCVHHCLLVCLCNTACRACATLPAAVPVAVPV